MNLSLRIFLAYFALVGVAVWFVMQSFTDELVPGIRQSLEEVLVDTANLLAEVVESEVVDGSVNNGAFANSLEGFSHRRLKARIWFFKKRDPNLIVYITDAQGKVIFDSRGRDLGEDYSKWNDVYLTLQGKYGARTTREDPNDDLSSVMYVAAPIQKDGKIIGVLTVGKPSITVQPFVESAIQNVKSKGIWVIGIAMLVGVLISYWLTISIRRLTRYALAVRAGQRVKAPRVREKELSQLAEAMASMRAELEGKHYVENYLHTLTHELKSPLAAIQGAAELLDEEMPKEKQRRFIGNIRNESERLKQVVDRLLGLASLEKRQGLDNIESITLAPLVQRLCRDKAPILEQKGLKLSVEIPENATVQGERFLLQQAISNLLDNAIDFSPQQGKITIEADRQERGWSVVIHDQGPGIAEYAEPRLFERFYSLPRPETGRKSTGLGLSLVKEVALLHGGNITVTNSAEGGAVARLYLPEDQVISTVRVYS